MEGMQKGGGGGGIKRRDGAKLMTVFVPSALLFAARSAQ